VLHFVAIKGFFLDRFAYFQAKVIIDGVTSFLSPGNSTINRIKGYYLLHSKFITNISIQGRTRA
jgi:hypothetical protein